MTLHSPSRTSSACRSVAPGRPTIGRPLAASLLLQDSSPLRRSQPEQSTSRCGVFPQDRPPALTDGPPRSGHPRSRSGGSTAPRHGGPAPLRSAYAVSHDLDGLLLLGPCGVFRPLTPLGFGSRLPAASPGRSTRRSPFPALVRVVRTKVRPTRTRGASDHPGGSRSVPPRTVPEGTTRSTTPPLPLPKEQVRLRLPNTLPGRLRVRTTEVALRLDSGPELPRPRSKAPGPSRRRTATTFLPVPVRGLPLPCAPMAS
jgi:hypothetical protein